MKNQKKSTLRKLLWRYKKAIIIWFVIALFFIFSSIFIYSFGSKDNSVEKVIADLLMTIGQGIIVAGLLGGGIGGGVNFIVEEFKKEEEEAKERKIFRKKMQDALQDVHDNVELARVLIKSHRSGRTYGEQIRSRIMPSLISLKDFRRELEHIEDVRLQENLDYLYVSLTHMIAYLSILVREFEENYLKISNLQNYQDALVNRMRVLFTEITEGRKERKEGFLKSAEELLGNTDVPSNIEVVWQAIEKLYYLWDFISETRNEKGEKSLYYQHFLLHYFHCNKILKSRDSKISQRLTRRKNFIDNIEELKRIEEKKNSDEPLTSKDSLTRRIMENELHFDFETSNFRLS